MLVGENRELKLFLPSQVQRSNVANPGGYRLLLTQLGIEIECRRQSAQNEVSTRESEERRTWVGGLFPTPDPERSGLGQEQGPGFQS